MEENIQKKIIEIPNTVTVKRFGELLNVPVSKVIMELMKNKIIASINEEIDFDTASIIAQDMGFETKEEEKVLSEELMTLEKLIEILKKEKEENGSLKSRPPVVTILGHVDHGKTTLLDAIRKTNVALQEAGGITQHISAYQVKKKGQIVTFVDTPGHEAFSAMRERGVSIADIAVLVVAADDGVRPQTKEVIEYLKAKKIPTVVAINKVDKPEANVQRAKQELAENGIMLEGWGGDVISAEISAKKNLGIDELLESVLLVTEVEEFKADFKRSALGIVLEAHLDPQKGPVATVLIKTGTLKVGQDIIAGTSWGRVRKMEDFAGKNLDLATPSTPITIMGFNNVPNVNDILQVVSGKSIARVKSQEAEKSLEQRKKSGVKKAEESNEDIKKLNIILKSDVQGSLEALEQILNEIKSDEVMIDFINTAVGNITESDVKIAQSSNAVIFGFNVIATSVAKRIAENAGIQIKTYGIIYELVEVVKNMMADLLPPEIVRTDSGRLKVMAIFKTGKRDMIVGGRVIEGKMIKGESIEIKRDDEIVGKGKLSNLQQNKQAAEEVNQGNECGITFDGNVKIKEGDLLICYKEETVKRKL